MCAARLFCRWLKRCLRVELASAHRAGMLTAEHPGLCLRAAQGRFRVYCPIHRRRYNATPPERNIRPQTLPWNKRSPQRARWRRTMYSRLRVLGNARGRDWGAATSAEGPDERVICPGRGRAAVVSGRAGGAAGVSSRADRGEGASRSADGSRVSVVAMCVSIPLRSRGARRTANQGLMCYLSRAGGGKCFFVLRQIGSYCLCMPVACKSLHDRA